MRKSSAISLVIFFLTIPNLAFAKSNFNGIYAGLAGGYARGTDKGLEYKDDGASYYGGRQQTKPAGFFASVFAGGNFVVDKNILFGAEVDYDRRDHTHASFQQVNNGEVDSYPVSTKVRNTRTLRGRVGYIFNADKTLAYLTAGYAMADVKRTYSDTLNTLGNGTSIHINTRHKGYVSGFGIEHFLTDKVSLRGEYRYVRYAARSDIDASLIYGAGTIEKQRFRDQSWRLGVAYNF